MCFLCVCLWERVIMSPYSSAILLSSLPEVLYATLLICSLPSVMEPHNKVLNIVREKGVSSAASHTVGGVRHSPLAFSFPWGRNYELCHLGDAGKDKLLLPTPSFFLQWNASLLETWTFTKVLLSLGNHPLLPSKCSIGINHSQEELWLVQPPVISMTGTKICLLITQGTSSDFSWFLGMWYWVP